MPEDHTYLCDSIQIRPVPKLIENAELTQKYRQSSLSAQQLADESGVSKQMVLGRLRQAGVRGGKEGGDRQKTFDSRILPTAAGSPRVGSRRILPR